jgi:hypothetical protein
LTSTAMHELLRLKRLGFHYTQILGDDGELDMVLFVRDTPEWHEVVLVYSEEQARAYRTRPRPASGNPLMVAGGVVDKLLPLDDVVSTVQRLLTLPSTRPAGRPEEG